MPNALIVLTTITNLTSFNSWTLIDAQVFVNEQDKFIIAAGRTAEGPHVLVTSKLQHLKLTAWQRQDLHRALYYYTKRIARKENHRPWKMFCPC